MSGVFYAPYRLEKDTVIHGNLQWTVTKVAAEVANGAIHGHDASVSDVSGSYTGDLIDDILEYHSTYRKGGLGMLGGVQSPV